MSGKRSYTVLDLPEPFRSQRLAEMGMTAEEFAAHMAGWEALEARREAEARANGTWDEPQARDDAAADAAVTFVPGSKA